MSSPLPNPSSFERLERRYRLRAELVTVTGFRVGAGKRFEAAATDQPVIRDALGRPYLPGSSLKGALRSGLESVLRGLGHDELRACELFDDPCVSELQDRAKKGETIAIEEVQGALCPVCGLFGSTFLAGRVFVHDLPIEEGSARPPEVRDGVGINRDLRTAQGQIKYDFEVLSPGTHFRLEMLLENVDEVQLALALKALELLHQGQILVGGLTSRGLGRLRVDAPELARTDPKRLLTGADYEALDYAEAQRQASDCLADILVPGGNGDA